MLLTENIMLPGVGDAFAAINTHNAMTYNKAFYTGEIEELSSEYFHFIEAQRLEKLHRLHRLLGPEGEIKPELLNRHVIILVSDGLSTGFSLDVAKDYLKVIKATRILIASPIASVSAVDRMRLIGDEVYCLDVRENYIQTNHYYEDNTIPDMESLFKIIRNISLSWMASELAMASN
jgi:predicted phosphoribosyltransferase